MHNSWLNHTTTKVRRREGQGREERLSLFTISLLLNESQRENLWAGKVLSWNCWLSCQCWSHNLHRARNLQSEAYWTNTQATDATARHHHHPRDEHAKDVRAICWFFIFRQQEAIWTPTNSFHSRSSSLNCGNDEMTSDLWVKSAIKVCQKNFMFTPMSRVARAAISEGSTCKMCNTSTSSLSYFTHHPTAEGISNADRWIFDELLK